MPRQTLVLSAVMLSVVRYVLICSMLMLTISGCIVVKSTPQEEQQEQENEKKPRIPMLPNKPSVEMSEELVRSEQGDMVCVLPATWFLLNAKANAPQAVFAVATNPDYTLGLAYSLLRKEDTFDQLLQKEGMAAIAKASMNRRERRTPATKLVGELREVMVGTKRFGLYNYTTDNGATLNRVAVFRSALGNYYECTLTEFPFTGRKLPTREESEEIFNSVLAVLDF
jgi:hypothetical protein